uniref:Hypoxanthine-guanine phosphoribosyltransferase (EC) n=1 Tax=uncultured Thiotrichaceae bacterium TaxID=298394 RepID=A0A6S6S6X6_9GAMM|nr:MAG: Hypoxanthine-guanine phosphoribosyltransferase (EC [uncultured Thiotrichaceae bacterium]
MVISMSDIVKTYLTPQDLMDSSLLLAQKIFESGFRPDFIVAIWRGGTPVGIAIQEFYEYLNFSTDHIAIRTSYYSGLNKVRDKVRVHGLEYLTKNINAEDSLLIVDDVFDTGNSIKAALERIQERSRKNTPHDIRIATPYYKPSKNQTGITPDYYVYETDEWLVFPHELKGLTREEIRQHKPSIVSEWIDKHLDDIPDDNL